MEDEIKSLLKMESSWTVEDEFQKNSELKQEDMQALKKWRIECRPNIPEIPDKLLILFLHSCYYDLERTIKCITRYYEIRANSSDFFTNRDVRRPELQKALSVLRFCIFPARDPNGNVIICHRLKVFEPSEYVFCDGVKLLGMAMDTAFYLYGTVPGVVILFDMTGVRFGHIMRCSIFAIRRLFQYVQEGNPIRLKAIHVVSANSVVDKILVIIKPFIQRKLLALLHFHTGNNSTVYEYLPKSCLPSDYGGDHESIDEMHEKYKKLVEELLPYFEEEEASRNV